MEEEVAYEADLASSISSSWCRTSPCLQASWQAVVMCPGLDGATRVLIQNIKKFKQEKRVYYIFIPTKLLVFILK